MDPSRRHPHRHRAAHHRGRLRYGPLPGACPGRNRVTDAPDTAYGAMVPTTPRPAEPRSSEPPTAPEAHAEERLEGGNTTTVVRVADTVRRSVGPWTPAVHALLEHLHAVGFDGAPRVLGIDDLDREVLAYVDGEVGTLTPDRPLSPWFRGPDACRAIGRWISEFPATRHSASIRPTASPCGRTSTLEPVPSR